MRKFIYWKASPALEATHESKSASATSANRGGMQLETVTLPVRCHFLCGPCAALSKTSSLTYRFDASGNASSAARRGQDLGLTNDGVAFYEALAANASALQAMGEDKLKVIAAELITKVRLSVTIDWTPRESARAKIRVMAKRILNKYGYPPDLQDEALKTVLQQAELLCTDWAEQGL